MKEVNGKVKAVKTKEVEHYLNKAEKELVKALGETRGETVYGALTVTWNHTFIDKEDMRSSISWDRAQISILNMAELISDSTYEGLKEELIKLATKIAKAPF